MKLLLCVVLASLVVGAQDAARLLFDAASIRKNTSGSGVSGGRVGNGQLQGTAVEHQGHGFSSASGRLVANGAAPPRLLINWGERL